MQDAKPEKMSIDDFNKTATMFYIDADIERKYAAEIARTVPELQASMSAINTMDGLERYIRSDKEALDRLIGLLNISEEKFRRVATMIRVQKKHQITSEWSLKEIRNKMLDYPAFMGEICELLMKGADMDEYKTRIPACYLDHFRIGDAIMNRLADPDGLRQLVKKSLLGEYNNKIGTSFFNKAADKIKTVCDKNGLTYAIKKPVPLIGGAVAHMAIPDADDPRLLIDIRYSITTSSSQSTYAKDSCKASEALRKANGDKPAKDKVFYVKVMDGAGWVARGADITKIHRCADYLLNLNTLDSFGDIITYVYGGIKK